MMRVCVCCCHCLLQLLPVWGIHRRVVNGLQVLIAKGRKNKRRNALQGNYAPVHVSSCCGTLPLHMLTSTACCNRTTVMLYKHCKGAR